MTWNSAHNLYPYQAQASEFLQTSDYLLAFEMGCGKTPTTLHAIEALGDFPGTVVVPASLKHQWGREIAKFTDSDVVVVDGPPKKRRELYENFTAQYLVLTYNTFVSDYDQHKGLANEFLVLDECTAIKNFRSKRSKHIKSVRDNYGALYALTGTPMENGQLEEVFSIMEFVDPQLFGNYWNFESKYINRHPTMKFITGYRNVNDFHARLKHRMVRATTEQEEVRRYLPDVVELPTQYVDADKATMRAYRYMADTLLSELDAYVETMRKQEDNPDFPDHPSGWVMAQIGVIRMLLNHPAAVLESAAKYASDTDGDGSRFAEDVVSLGLVKPNMPSKKAEAAVEYITDFLDIAKENKVVMFCSSVRAVDELRRMFKEGTAVVYTGSMSASQRDDAVQRFVSDPLTRVLVATDAGAYGLNLQVANLVVNYDLPWQAGALKQRNARIRRAGSGHQRVSMVTFVTRGTMEERMLDLVGHKIAVEDAVLDGVGITTEGDIASEITTLRSFLSDQVVDTMDPIDRD